MNACLFKATVFVFAVTMLLFACAAPKKTKTEEPERTGAVAWEYIFDSKGRRPELAANQDFQKPYPMEQPLPAYPEEALASQREPVTVAVRIFVGKGGMIDEILDSPLEASTPSPLLALFRTAVDNAVRTWKFSPPSFRTFRDGEDLDGDGEADYRILVEQKSVRVYYDLRFLFEIVEGKGTVTLQNRKAPRR